jgi:hypothetical protein
MANTQTRTVVLGSDQLGARRRQSNALFARTPLELIHLVENNDVSRVLLAGEYLDRHDVADFIHDEYPTISVCYEHLERPRPVAIIWQLAYA